MCLESIRDRMTRLYFLPPSHIGHVKVLFPGVKLMSFCGGFPLSSKKGVEESMDRGFKGSGVRL